MSEIFKSIGVDYVIEGGQTMNPSTADILDAVEKVNAENVFVLPNNKNIILAARQAAELMTDKNLLVIPTKTIPQGITAVINYMDGSSVDENEEMMISDQHVILRAGLPVHDSAARIQKDHLISRLHADAERVTAIFLVFPGRNGHRAAHPQ